MKNPYDDIINLPYIKSSSHPHMSAYDRAAQFSPFSALTGYEDAVYETGRITDEERELTDEMKEEISQKIQKALKSGTKAVVLYFLPDKTKSGGKEVTYTGTIKKADAYENALVFTDGTKIPLDKIKDILNVSL